MNLGYGCGGRRNIEVMRVVGQVMMNTTRRLLRISLSLRVVDLGCTQDAPRCRTRGFLPTLQRSGDEDWYKFTIHACSMWSSTVRDVSLSLVPHVTRHWMDEHMHTLVVSSSTRVQLHPVDLLSTFQYYRHLYHNRAPETSYCRFESWLRLRGC
ncbi:hypothetical protein BDQ17DRAFT_631398 [Cyathus striatus]|nr:hypothetical protein BDQ17DRAFT_812557 [Cyathus striatus]KAF9001273.1 hypothetical protein BDQ17DRAFT_631398 [Cyathus striatus]